MLSPVISTFMLSPLSTATGTGPRRPRAPRAAAGRPAAPSIALRLASAPPSMIASSRAPSARGGDRVPDRRDDQLRLVELDVTAAPVGDDELPSRRAIGQRLVAPQLPEIGRAHV